MKILIILLVVLIVTLTGCSKLTVENYAKVKTGIDYAEVVRILGKPDSCSDALFIKNCVWGNEQKNISVNFINDKVMFTSSRNIK